MTAPTPVPTSREEALDSWARSNTKAVAWLMPAVAAIPLLICLALWRMTAGFVSILGLIGTGVFGLLFLLMLAVPLLAESMPRTE